MEKQKIYDLIYGESFVCKKKLRPIGNVRL